jgi:mRNA-degrading endonuclease RelE of RelBE toxin-antitoxin system
VILLHTGHVTFLASAMKKSKRLPDQTQQRLLDEVRVELANPAPIPPIHKLLHQRH